MLRHSHLMSYVMSTLEFAGADRGRGRRWSACRRTTSPGSRRSCQLAVHRPPDRLPAELHAGRLGRRRRHAPRHPRDGRADDARPGPRRDAQRRGRGLPTLRHLSYGGGRMPVDVIERALGDAADVDFVNAYGLTETSSTIAVLAPGRPPRRARLRRSGRARAGSARSAGRARRSRCRSATRTANGCRPASSGEIWVRGEQVSGEYVGRELRERPTAGSPPTTAARSTRRATCTSRAGSTT